jgi:hypothetical protein
MYAYEVSRETVRMALLMVALPDLEVKITDIKNAGKRAIICRALFDFKGSGTAYRNHVANCIYHLWYQQCEADPDLWMLLPRNMTMDLNIYP